MHMNKKLINVVNNGDISVGDRIVVVHGDGEWEGVTGEVIDVWKRSNTFEDGWKVNLDAQYKYLLSNKNRDYAKLCDKDIEKL